MQYLISWQAYQNDVCRGLSSLQQNGEFVDMTLAADGHLVRVHQMVIALASPYLKEIIQSVSCPHPVIFLNNVSQKTLCSLLEFIYTGEALVPADNLSMFFEAAKSLHIKGLEEMIPALATSPKENDSSKKDTLSGTEANRLPAEYSDNGGVDDDIMDYDDTAVATSGVNDENKNPPATNLQFTLSNRGSLQIILNRYMYNLHSTSHRSGVKRWGCIEYRHKKCQAFLHTKGNVVLNRGNLHNHSFHDQKILGKLKQNTIFSTLDDVKSIRDKKKGTHGEEQEYSKLNTSHDDDKDTVTTD